MLTVTDLFAGAGGSSTGAMQVPGVHVRIAANHWQTAIDIHNLNHQDTDHAVVDLHLERPSFFPRTDVLWASPECTKWSQANGTKLPAIEEGLFEDPLSDEAKTRSRLLMFDVLRFIEYHRYQLVFVENVVDIATQAKYATAWRIWREELRALGYKWRVVSLNSMHAQTFGLPAPQSRDRIYIVAWPEREKPPELDRVLRPRAYCPRCDVVAESVQAFKPGREVGRYRQAYVYMCRTCGKSVEPGWLPAIEAIDWSIPGERVGDRLKPKTRARIAVGIARYWGPLVVENGGNQYDAADPNHRAHGDPDGYYRSWPVSDPLRTLHGTATKALAVPVEGRDGKEALPVDWPLRTQTTRQETALAYILERRGEYRTRSLNEALSTITANETTKALIGHPFLAEMRGGSCDARSVNEPMATVTAGGNHHALVMSYYSRGVAVKRATDPVATITTRDRHALIQQPERRTVTAADMDAAMEMVPEVLFRMLQPHEIAAGMAFPADYKWQPPDRKRPVSNRDLVKAAGNAVTPPAARDLVAVGAEGLGVA